MPKAGVIVDVITMKIYALPCIIRIQSRPSGRSPLCRHGKYKDLQEWSQKLEHCWSQCSNEILVSFFSPPNEEGPPQMYGETVMLVWSTREYRHFGWIFPPFTEYLGACISRWTEVCRWESGWRHDVTHVQVLLPHGSLPCGWCTRSHAVIISTWKSHEDGNKGYRLSAYTAPL